MELSGQFPAPAALSPGKIPGTHWIGGYWGSRDGPEGFGKQCLFLLPGFEPRLKELIALGRRHFRVRQKMYRDVTRNGFDFATFVQLFMAGSSEMCNFRISL